MATSKTLTPTNVTISIPEMTDSPDASVFSNCVDKEADAINSLNSNITTINSKLNILPITQKITEGTAGTVKFTFNGNRYTCLLFITRNNGYNSIYAIGYKASYNTNFVTKLAGVDSTITQDSDGSISTYLDAWSTAVLMGSMSGSFT